MTITDKIKILDKKVQNKLENISIIGWSFRDLMLFVTWVLSIMFYIISIYNGIITVMIRHKEYEKQKQN